ncbi:WAT1-related protein At5g07050-like [Vigna umbellata]|uniref:WAT1-related protein At5g07050-like n=1 Tax=Vigna umbellata TaxID=87088 RepID=UPI001F5EE4C8|nr:WAT1-related protein At5g07050-like [Vigna umbellata]
MATEKLGGCAKFFECSKPYLAMISLQFGYAGMTIITKISLNQGMSHYVLVVYRHAFATIAIAPFAFIFERKGQPKIAFSIFMQIFILALLGPVIDQNFFYAGLKLTSPTFACAISNMLPAMTFVIAVFCRMEKINIKQVRSIAKIVGTLVTVGGAMLMTLYRGPIVEMVWIKQAHYKTNGTTSTGSLDRDWLLGCIFLIISTIAWASLFVLQAKAIQTYKNHQLTLTSLVCFMGTVQAIVVTYVVEHNPSVWKIGWDINLLTAAYSGVVSSSISYYVQGLVIKKKGPVFATSFSPLMMIISAIMGYFILAEKTYLGGVIGAILIVIGLYSVLWGKHKEQMENQVEAEIPLPVNDAESSVTEEQNMVDARDYFTEEKHDQKVEPINLKFSSIVITLSIQESPTR